MFFFAKVSDFTVPVKNHMHGYSLTGADPGFLKGGVTKQWL